MSKDQKIKVHLTSVSKKVYLTSVRATYVRNAIKMVPCCVYVKTVIKHLPWNIRRVIHLHQTGIEMIQCIIVNIHSKVTQQIIQMLWQRYHRN